MATAGADSGITDVDETVLQLLDKLGTRRITANEAKSHVVAFLRRNGIEEGSHELEMFGRLLDRNLAAGFGARTLSSIVWDPEYQHDQPLSAAQSHNPPDIEVSDRAAKNVDTRASHGGSELKAFSVALGKSISPPFTDITRSSCKWYASRKLDGVRVITFLDFRLHPSRDLEIVNVEFRSRNGKLFTSLAKVEEQLRTLVRFPRVREWLEQDSAVVSTAGGMPVKRLVLDGEVCVMREKKRVSTDLRTDAGTGAGAIWSDTNLEEDFTSTVSEIRRNPPYTIAHPVYFIFDILDKTNFEKSSGPSTFGERLQDIRHLGEWLTTQGEQQKVLRPLAQWEVKDATEIDSLVARAADEGWEGLVLRADKPYKGTRS